MSMVFQGRGVSEGMAMGAVFLLAQQTLKAPDTPARDPETEVEQFEAAMARTQARLQDLYDQACRKLGKKEAEIFDAHLTFLQDEYSVSMPIEELIRADKLTAAQAVQRQFDALADMFRALDDELMSERAADAEDLKQQLLRAILGLPEQDVTRLDQDVILLADELMPSDTVRMDVSHVVGLATRLGGVTAHTAVIARTLGIPAVVGLTGWEAQVENGAQAILDGTTGRLIVAPSREEQEACAAARAEAERQTQELAAFRNRPTVTSDGVHVGLFANIGSPEEAGTSAALGAEGVGLFRSEFLFMDREDLPTEEEQFCAYRKALETMGGKPVVVRTLDVGGDKKLPALPLPREDNPFLGCRAIRMTLKRPDLFRPQLRALLRASAYGTLHIMFPMISGLGELRAVKAMLEQERRQLQGDGVPMGPVKVGIMVEIPAAAVMADQFAKEVDFFSIGTNDLIQYTLAAERGNEHVADLYTAYHPAVLRLIAATAKAARDNGILCGMCGEAAGDARLTAALVGMGLGELSMSPRLIPKLRKLLSEWTMDQCRQRAEELLSLPDEAAVKRYLEQAG